MEGLKEHDIPLSLPLSTFFFAAGEVTLPPQTAIACEKYKVEFRLAFLTHHFPVYRGNGQTVEEYTLFLYCNML